MESRLPVVEGGVCVLASFFGTAKSAVSVATSFLMIDDAYLMGYTKLSLSYACNIKLSTYKCLQILIVYSVCALLYIRTIL